MQIIMYDKWQEITSQCFTLTDKNNQTNSISSESLFSFLAGPAVFDQDAARLFLRHLICFTSKKSSQTDWDEQFD